MHRAVRSVEERMRTVKWEQHHCVWAWYVGYVNFLLNRVQVGHDAKDVERWFVFMCNSTVIERTAASVCNTEAISLATTALRLG